MGIWKHLSQTCRIEVISGNLSWLLTELNEADISLSDVRNLDELRMEATIAKDMLPILKKITQRNADTVNIISETGLSWQIKKLMRRPVLLFGVIFLLLMTVILPTKILFFEVKGNVKLPDNYILDVAQSCGIHFFASRAQVRSEKLKNALLSAVPQLQWVGINTRGCVAVISVREKREDVDSPISETPCSIVACKDGIIQEMTVLSGTPLCRVGQGVKKGQVLVSGFTDCGLTIRLERAEAEIFAYTTRSLQGITPSVYLNRTAVQRKKTKIMFRIGKNIINLWKDSRISGARCVKMCNEKILTLPGGFQLPVSIIKETVVFYDLQDVVETEQIDWLCASMKDYTSGCMNAGIILKEEIETLPVENLHSLRANYICLEMIGQVRREESLLQNDT